MITETVPHESDPNRNWLVYFKHESATGMIVIPESEDESGVAFLRDVYSRWPRGGHGSKLLQEIRTYCRQNQIELVIEAIWHEGEPGSISDNDTLRAFYEKNGATFWREGKYGPILRMGI